MLPPETQCSTAADGPSSAPVYLPHNHMQTQDVADTSLLITSLWCIGEFGEMLLPGAGGTLLEGEPAVNATDKDVVDLVAAVVLRRASDPVVRWVLVLTGAVCPDTCLCAAWGILLGRHLGRMRRSVQGA